MRRAESEIGTLVLQWLVAQGWDCYPEVQTHSGGARADLVAMRGAATMVVECKTVLSLDLLAQAHSWLGHANFVCVATEPARRGIGREYAAQLCRRDGIGLVEVGRALPTGRWDAWHVTAPRFLRRTTNRLRTALSPHHKDHVPGNADSSYHTPWRETCLRLRELVRRGPLTIRDAIARLEHHYGNDCTARSCLRQWVAAGKVAGVVLDTSQRPYRFALDPAPNRA